MLVMQAFFPDKLTYHITQSCFHFNATLKNFEIIKNRFERCFNLICQQLS